jgi:gamma-glutamylaminecyclotransferase
MPNVFAYGTLKRGFPLHPCGMSQARYLGAYQTTRPYPLLIACDFFGPIMLDQPGRGLPVRGELFAVPDESLPTLDRLEAVGKPGSFRTTLEVEPLGGGLRVPAIGFMKDESWLDPVHSGFLADYQDRRFIPPWQRSA